MRPWTPHLLPALQEESGKAAARREGPQPSRPLVPQAFRYLCAEGTQEVSGLGTVGATEQVRRVAGVGGCPAPSCRTPAGRGSQPAHPGPGGPCSTRGCRCGPRSPGRAQTGRGRKVRSGWGSWVPSRRTHRTQHPPPREFHRRLYFGSLVPAIPSPETSNEQRGSKDAGKAGLNPVS